MKVIIIEDEPRTAKELSGILETLDSTITVLTILSSVASAIKWFREQPAPDLIFADIQLDTHLYDVNVSPDKRTILLHDQGQMLDNLRESLIELFRQRSGRLVDL